MAYNNLRLSALLLVKIFKSMVELDSSLMLVPIRYLERVAEIPILKYFKNASLLQCTYLPKHQIFPTIDIETDKSDHLACIRCQDQNV